MSREKQISAMAKILTGYEGCGDCPNCKFHGICGEELQATNLYNAEYRKLSGWISVDERLPCDTGEPEEYLVMLEHAYSPTVAMFYGGRFAKSAFCKCTVLGSKVTHWMPLPEPPMMKGGAE